MGNCRECGGIGFVSGRGPMTLKSGAVVKNVEQVIRCSRYIAYFRAAGDVLERYPETVPVVRSEDYCGAAIECHEALIRQARAREAAKNNKGDRRKPEF